MRSRLMASATYFAGLLFIVHSVQNIAFAGAVSDVPEIDGSSISVGLGLLAGAVLIIRARRRSK